MPRLIRPAHERVLDRSVAGPGGCILFTGSLTSWGYGHVSIRRGVQASAHVIVFEALVGPVPDGMTVDHRCLVHNCVNHLHLRLLTGTGNRQAVGLSKRNTSGYRGVRFQDGRWTARVRHDGRNHYLGRFDTAEEAAEAARQGRLRLHEAHASYDLEPIT